MEAEFHHYRQQIEMTIDTDAAQELRMLRGMVQSLEEELTTSQAKHQRLMLKRSRQCRLLIDEVNKCVVCRKMPAPFLCYTVTVLRGGGIE